MLEVVREDEPRGTAAANGSVRAGVFGIGAALPANVVGNDEVAARLGVDPSWIEKRTGIATRRRLGPGERLDALATQAARDALDEAIVDPADLDLVVCATFTADDHTPGMAPLVAAALGSSTAALDVNGACVGFLHALDLASSAIGAGRARAVLVIGADAVTRYIDHDDRRTAPLFGDGAGAVVLVAGRGDVAPFVLRSAGEHADLIRASRTDPFVRMEGHETFLLATTSLCDATAQACVAAGVALDDIDKFVFHQANRRILEAVRQRLDLDPDKVVDAIEDVGNTSAASIPLALSGARPRSGERVLLGAMGAGFVYGAGVLTWP